MIIQTLWRRIGMRTLASIPTLVVVVVFTFVLMRMLPGDPAVYFASGPNAGQAEIDMLRHKMGLDLPLPLQLLHYMVDLLHGDLGMSLTTGQPVMRDIAERLPASLELTLGALGLSLLVAIPMGVAAAWFVNTKLDLCIRLVCTICFCVPPFVSAIFLVYIFYYSLGISPDPTGRFNIFSPLPPRLTGFLLIDFFVARDWGGWREAAGQLILPALTMSLFVLSPLTRMTRGSLLSVMNSDFIRTARAMGLPTWRIIVTYALHNALPPILTTTGIVFSTMLGANVLVEKVFSWPGVASYALDALVASDYAPVQGFILLMAFLFIMVNLLIDILQSILDPRVSME